MDDARADSARPLDRIELRGLEVFAHHGVFDFEAEQGQPFVVDVVVHADLSQAAASDDLAATVDYGRLATAIHDRVTAERWQLIERVAERVADLVLENPRAAAVDVSIHKPDAPMSVPFTDVVVSIHRRR